MSILLHKNKPSNTSDNSDDTGADKSTVSELGKLIFFVAGESGCGKSIFLAALIQKKFNFTVFYHRRCEAARNALFAGFGTNAGSFDISPNTAKQIGVICAA